MTKNNTNPLTGQPLQGSSNDGRGAHGWRLVIILIIGFALGFGASWLWVNQPDENDAEIDADEVLMDENDDADSGDTMSDSNDAVTDADDANASVGGDVTVTGSSEDEVLVKDQEAGSTVFITRVTLTQDGWVAVQEILPSGQLGNILGAKRFNEGVSQGTVGLLRGTSAGTTYAVTLWYDDGDGAFDHTADALVLNSGGAVVAQEFEAYSTISE